MAGRKSTFAEAAFLAGRVRHYEDEMGVPSCLCGVDLYSPLLYTAGLSRKKILETQPLPMRMYMAIYERKGLTIRQIREMFPEYPEEEIEFSLRILSKPILPGSRGFLTLDSRGRYKARSKGRYKVRSREAYEFLATMPEEIKKQAREIEGKRRLALKMAHKDLEEDQSIF